MSVSLPYEPGRPAFTSLRRTAEDLQRLAGDRIEELPPRYAEVAQPAIAHLERALFADEAHEPVPIDGAVRFFEAAGARGALELVGEELLALLRAGTPRRGDRRHLPERRPLARSARDGVRHARHPVCGRRRGTVAQTPFGQALALAAALRLARRLARRSLHVPALAVLRRRAARRRLRRRTAARPRRAGARAGRRGGREAARPRRSRRSPSSATPTTRSTAVRVLAARMLRNAYGLEAPPVGEASRLDLRTYETLNELLARARALAHARRRALARRRRVGARAPDAAAPARRRARTRRRRRPAARAHTPLRRRLRARARGREPAAARLRRRRSSTTTHAGCSTSAARACSGPIR